MKNRSKFFKDLAFIFYGLDREASEVSTGFIDSCWMQRMQGSIKALYDCVAAFSERDQREDLRNTNIPTLFFMAIMIRLCLRFYPARRL